MLCTPDQSGTRCRVCGWKYRGRQPVMPMRQCGRSPAGPPPTTEEILAERWNPDAHDAWEVVLARLAVCCACEAKGPDCCTDLGGCNARDRWHGALLGLRALRCPRDRFPWLVCAGCGWQRIKGRCGCG